MTCNKICFFWLGLHWMPESRPPLALQHRWQLSDFSLSTGQQCNHCQYSMYLDCSLLWYIEGWWCVDTKSDNWFWVAVGLKTIRRGWSVGLLWSALSWLRWRERQSQRTQNQPGSLTCTELNGMPQEPECVYHHSSQLTEQRWQVQKLMVIVSGMKLC